MIKITIAYPRVAGRAFDHDYFLDRHLPRLLDRVGHAVRRTTVERGVDAAPWPDAEHELVCSLECESREAFEAAFFPHIEELQDDMERCGGAPPSISLAETVFEQAARETGISRPMVQLHRLRAPSGACAKVAARG